MGNFVNIFRERDFLGMTECCKIEISRTAVIIVLFKTVLISILYLSIILSK